MTRLIVGIAALAALGLASSANALVCYDQADLDAAGANATVVWGDTAAESEIILEETMFVRNGQTLQILPGTIIRGLPRLDLVASAASAPGSLIVTQNGKIEAIGSPLSPVVFTTAAMDNNGDDIPDPKPGDAAFYERYDCNTMPAVTFYDDDPLNVTRPPLAKNGRNNVQMWGGLVLLGNAPTNLDRSKTDGGGGVAAGFGKGFIEGLDNLLFAVADRIYGGQYPHDDSGTLQYVRIQFGGDEIGTGNEINGLTLAGVGDATTISHVEVYVNYDDGIEWFGGTVNADHVSVVFAGDDQFDVDQGYTGTNQSMLAVLPFFTANAVDPRTGTTIFGAESGDEGCECDGDDLAGSTPAGSLLGQAFSGMAIAFSSLAPPGAGDDLNYPGRAHFASFYNLTVLSHDGLSSTDFTPTNAANGQLQMRNGFGGMFVNSIVANTGAADPIGCLTTRMSGYNCVDNVNKTSIAGRTPVVRIVSSVFDGYTNAIAGTPLQALANGNAMDTNAAFHNITQATGGFSGLVQADYTFDPQGDANGEVNISLKPVNGVIDPVPAGSGGYDFGQSTGPDRSINYRGAFSKGEPKWTDGWSALSVAGLL